MCDTRVFPNKRNVNHFANKLNTLYFLQTALHSAYQAFGRNSDKREQQALEAYFSQSLSMADLENRERQWMSSHNSGNAFTAVAH